MAQEVQITPHPGYKSSGVHWTRILERLFPLPRLGVFPALSQLPSDAEAEVIDRFLVQALRLTESEGLNGASGVRNRWSREEGWTVDSNFPSYEAITGLAAHFRQLCSTKGRPRIELFGKDLSDSAIYYRLRRDREHGIPAERPCAEPGCTRSLPAHASRRRRYCDFHGASHARVSRYRAREKNSQ